MKEVLIKTYEYNELKGDPKNKAIDFVNKELQQKFLQVYCDLPAVKKAIEKLNKDGIKATTDDIGVNLEYYGSYSFSDKVIFDIPFIVGQVCQSDEIAQACKDGNIEFNDEDNRFYGNDTPFVYMAEELNKWFHVYIDIRLEDYAKLVNIEELNYCYDKFDDFIAKEKPLFLCDGTPLTQVE